DHTVPLPERLQRIDGRVQRLRIERREERPGARDPLQGASLRGQVAGQGRNARWAWWQESRSRDPILDRLGIPRQARGGLNAILPCQLESMSRQGEKFLFQQSRKFLFETG